MYATLSQLKADRNLKPGDVAETLGYYEPGDGGAAAYAITGTAPDPAAGEASVDLGDGRHAVLVKPEAVTYRMFGAVGDGQADDVGKIAAAHAYANRHGLPVVNLSGRFRLGEPETIIIQTPVQWGQTVFYIDESRNSKTAPRFLVSASRPPADILLSDEEKAELLKLLVPGTTIIPLLAPYKNCLVVVRDENDLIGARYNYPKQIGWAKEEFFYVDEHGRIIGDIAWTFHNYTSLKAYPCEESYLVIEGGTFYVSGDSPGVNYEGYRWNGFHVKRSRTIIRNAWVGLEPGKADVALDPRRGFYSFDHVFDIALENVKLIPWEQDRGVKETVVPAGTYGLGGARVLNGTFRNVTAEGSNVHWGVFGTNLMKNFKIDSCRLNRVDVHFHCWNLHIRDSEIGYKGISVTGGGELIIENTKRYGDLFVNFRRDFGAKWDGDITIRNCRMFMTGRTEGAVLYHTPADFEYKYPIGFGRNILIDRLVLDYTGAASRDKPCWMMKIPPFARNLEGRRLFFPQRLVFRDISVVGREAGVRLFDIQNAHHYEMAGNGAYTADRLVPNCWMTFERVQLEELQPAGSRPTGQVHLRIAGGPDGEWDERSLHADVLIDRCGPVSASFAGSRASVTIRRSTVRGLDTAALDAGALKGGVLLEQCDLEASVEGEPEPPLWRLDAEQGVRFFGCRLYPPLADGVARPEHTDRYGFLSINRMLSHTHVMTELAPSIERYYAEKGEPVLPAYREMLKSHSGAEPAELRPNP